MAITEHTSQPTIEWTLGDFMLKARRMAKLEQKDIAEACGVSRALVGRWENDLSEPSYRRLVKFAEVTNFPLEILLGAFGYNSHNAGEAPDLALIQGKRRGDGPVTAALWLGPVNTT